MLDANDKAEIFGALLGEEGVRQGQKLVSVVGDVGQAMEDVPDAAVFDDQDAADALEYQKTVAELKMEFAGIAQTVAQDLMPALTDTAETLGEIAGLLSTIADSPITDVTRALDSWANPLNLAQKGIDGIQDSWSELTDPELTAGIELAGTEFSTFEQRVREGNEGVADSSADAATELDNLEAAYRAAAVETDRVAESTRNYTGNIRDMMNAQREAVDPLFAAQRAAERHREALAELNEEGGNTVENQRAVVESSMEMEAAMLEAAASSDVTAASLVQMGVDAGLTEEQANSLAESILGVKTQADDLVGEYEATIKADTAPAGRSIDEINEQLTRLSNRTVTTRVIVNYTNKGYRTPDGTILENARGGPIRGGQVSWGRRRGTGTVRCPLGRRPDHRRSSIGRTHGTRPRIRRLSGCCNTRKQRIRRRVPPHQRVHRQSPGRRARHDRREQPTRTRRNDAMSTWTIGRTVLEPHTTSAPDPGPILLSRSGDRVRIAGTYLPPSLSAGVAFAQQMDGYNTELVIPVIGPTAFGVTGFYTVSSVAVTAVENVTYTAGLWEWTANLVRIPNGFASVDVEFDWDETDNGATFGDVADIGDNNSAVSAPDSFIAYVVPDDTGQSSFDTERAFLNETAAYMLYGGGSGTDSYPGDGDPVAGRELLRRRGVHRDAISGLGVVSDHR